MNMSAHTDGAASGNPGPAGCGFTIEKGGFVIEEHSIPLGRKTNNVAEYTAFINALKRLHDLGATEVVIYSDSELAVRQILGVYKVKNPKLKPLHAEVMMLAASFKSFKVIHVRREDNLLADKLAKKAIKRVSNPIELNLQRDNS